MGRDLGEGHVAALERQLALAKGALGDMRRAYLQLEDVTQHLDSEAEELQAQARSLPHALDVLQETQSGWECLGCVTALACALGPLNDTHEEVICQIKPSNQSEWKWPHGCLQVFSLTHELRWYESMENQMRHAGVGKGIAASGGYGGPQRFDGGGGAPYGGGGGPRKYGGGPPMKMGQVGEKRRIEYDGGKRPMRGGKSGYGGGSK